MIGLQLDHDYLIDHRPDRAIQIRSLMLAILMQALTDLDLRNQRADVLDWIYSNDEEHVFSFTNICRALSMDAGKIKAMVKNPSRLLSGQLKLLSRLKPCVLPLVKPKMR